MSVPRKLVLASATFALAAALPALAQSRIVPADPKPFDRVNLRMVVDSCSFYKPSVGVRAEGTTLRVTYALIPCFAPGEPETVDVRLGSLPTGDYTVEVYNAGAGGSDRPVERLTFRVFPLLEPAVFPPIPKPLTDYTGLWWNPNESGWGLSLHQTPLHGVFGAWFVYGQNGQPEWYTLQAGQWLDPTTWRGTVYRTTGPFFAGPDYDPRLVLVQAAGTATLDFKHRTGEEDRARFIYTIGGVTTTKVIQRMSF